MKFFFLFVLLFIDTCHHQDQAFYPIFTAMSEMGEGDSDEEFFSAPIKTVKPQPPMYSPSRDKVSYDYKFEHSSDEEEDKKPVIKKVEPKKPEEVADVPVFLAKELGKVIKNEGPPPASTSYGYTSVTNANPSSIGPNMAIPGPNLGPRMIPPMGNPGPCIGNPGPGLGTIGNPGPFIGNPGPGMGSMGNPGPGMGNLGPGLGSFGNPGPGLGSMGNPGPGLGSFGNPGPGMGNMGPNFGNLGPNFGPNMGNFGPGMGNFGPNSGPPMLNMGGPVPNMRPLGPNPMGPMMNCGPMMGPFPGQNPMHNQMCPMGPNPMGMPMGPMNQIGMGMNMGPSMNPMGPNMNPMGPYNMGPRPMEMPRGPRNMGPGPSRPLITSDMVRPPRMESHAFISKPPVLTRPVVKPPPVRTPSPVDDEEEEEDRKRPAEGELAGFKNDGSFLDVFKKMKSSSETSETTETKPKPVPSIVGKRRGGRVLKTGMVEKVKKPEADDSDKPKDAWSLYMAEVKKYREANCEEDGKTRALVK